MTESNNCISAFMKDAEIIQAGTTIYSMSVSARNAEYQKLAKEYDVHFIFDDMDVKVDFYTIPRIDIMAIDSKGGYIATVGMMSDLDSDASICYIDKNKRTYIIAENAREFIANIAEWKENLRAYNEIHFFQTQKQAQTMYEFIDVGVFVSENES